MTKAPKEVLYICQYVIAETDTFVLILRIRVVMFHFEEQDH